MILLDERFDGLHRHQVLGLLHWVDWHRIFFNRDKLLRILDAQHLNHLAVQHGHVVQLRSCLRQLKSRLVLHNLLRHRRSVGVTHRDHVHHVIVRLLGFTVTVFWLVVILIRCVVSNDDLQEFELLLHRVVHT